MRAADQDLDRHDVHRGSVHNNPLPLVFIFGYKVAICPAGQIDMLIGVLSNQCLIKRKMIIHK